MECDHKLSFDKTVTLITKSFFRPFAPYTCEKCGRKCELSLSAGLRALCLIVTIVIGILLEVLIINCFMSRLLMFNVLLFVIGLCLAVLAWYGSLYLMAKLNKFTYAAAPEYRPIVNRISLKRR